MSNVNRALTIDRIEDKLIDLIRQLWTGLKRCTAELGALQPTRARRVPCSPVHSQFGILAREGPRG